MPYMDEYILYIYADQKDEWEQDNNNVYNREEKKNRPSVREDLIDVKHHMENMVLRKFNLGSGVARIDWGRVCGR